MPLLSREYCALSRFFSEINIFYLNTFLQKMRILLLILISSVVIHGSPTKPGSADSSVGSNYFLDNLKIYSSLNFWSIGLKKLSRS